MKSPQNYLFSTFPGFVGRKPPGVGDGNGTGRGAPNDGAAVGADAGRGATGWLGHGAGGATVCAVGIGRGAGAVNGAGDKGFGMDATLTAGLMAIVVAFTFACELAFLAVFFATTRFLALFLAADFPFFFRISNARFVVFAFFLECFDLLFNFFLAMIAS